jgi:hypothetical protein
MPDFNYSVIVVDVDGTICTDTNGNYLKASPYPQRIIKINSLFDRGVKIIFMTARGMDSCGGDQRMAHEKYYQFTVDQLNAWGIKFHELYLGKPKADLYIDDKAATLNFFDS